MASSSSDSALALALEYQTCALLAELDKRLKSIDDKWEPRVGALESKVVDAARSLADQSTTTRSNIQPRVDTSEQIPAAQFDAEVVADDWGGLFEQPTHLLEERNFDSSAALSFASATNAAFSNTDDVECGSVHSFAAENKPVCVYSSSDAPETKSANKMCGRAARAVARRGGFLLARDFPLFLSEFVADFRGDDPKDNWYIPCASAMAVDHHVDWAYWALQGSYALGQDVAGMGEVYGVLDWSWSKPRNETVLPRIQALQRPLQG